MVHVFAVRHVEIDTNGSCCDCSKFDASTSMLYVVMEHGEMDLAVFFRASKIHPDVLQRLIVPCWMQMLYAVQALHEQGIYIDNIQSIDSDALLQHSYARKQLLLSACLSHRNSVCQSVHLAHGWICLLYTSDAADE